MIMKIPAVISVILMMVGYCLSIKITDSAKHGPRAGTKYFKWTNILNSDLEKIWYRTEPETLDHRYRLHQEWVRTHPDYAHLTPRQLKTHGKYLVDKKNENLEIRKQGENFEIQSEAIILLERLKEPGINEKPIQKPFKWTQALKKDLLKIYLQTDPQNRYHGNRLHSRWVHLHPEHAHLTPQKLKKRASNMFRRGEIIPSNDKEEHEQQIKLYQLPRRCLKWPDQLKQNLIECYNRNFPGVYGHRREVYKDWIQLYPQHRFIKCNHLLQNARNFIKQRSEILNNNCQSGIHGENLRSDQQGSQEYTHQQNNNHQSFSIGSDLLINQNLSEEDFDELYRLLEE